MTESGRQRVGNREWEKEFETKSRRKRELVRGRQDGVNIHSS